jgi:hypothetical protein
VESRVDNPVINPVVSPLDNLLFNLQPSHLDNLQFSLLMNHLDSLRINHRGSHQDSRHLILHLIILCLSRTREVGTMRHPCCGSSTAWHTRMLMYPCCCLWMCGRRITSWPRNSGRR